VFFAGRGLGEFQKEKQKKTENRKRFPAEGRKEFSVVLLSPSHHLAAPGVQTSA
jgi:hypothetical protein